MDPRNQLTETSVFQFEHLGYNKTHQNKQVLQSMVKGTPLEGSFTYKTDAGKQVTMSYVDAFIDAAEYSGVSPVHLIARCKQEVLTYSGGKYVFSGSASGNVAGYEGYYNFFNIGASDSASGGAIKKGLQYAKTGSSSATKNQKMFIPWNNPYKAIMGGAKFIGDGYIAQGQDTLYLQKFNVSKYSTHSHQYMTNVQAPSSEGRKQHSGYKSIGNLNLPLVFKIPVYNGLPTKTSVYPDYLGDYYKKSFNHYLSQFTITNAKTNAVIVSPTTTGANKFYPKNTAQSFTINGADPVYIAARTASTKATMTMTAKFGSKTTTLKAGTPYSFEIGTTVITTKVKAENGDTRTYTTTITRTK